MRYLITTLAEYQTKFWIRVGLRLEADGNSVAFLSFDDASSEMLKRAGLRVFESSSVPAPQTAGACAQVFEKFGINNLNYWTSHERFAFGLTDGLTMRKKFASAISYAHEVCRNFSEEGGGRVVMVQELGGFLSVVGSYFAAKHNEIEHWFIEPSFFRGRLFFLRNTFSALEIAENKIETLNPEMLSYLENTIKNGTIVIPIKDKHQYTSPWNKVVNLSNIRRLFQKLWDKMISGKHYEFGYIRHHVASHLLLILNSIKLKNSYTNLDQISSFIYYPLHVPGDMALTLRTPHLLDQLALIDYLCRSAPDPYLVVIKEHPAMVGAVDSGRVKVLLRKYDNLRILPPGTNNYVVIAKAQAVVSINSKSGAEAALLGKRVLVLGDAFYKNSSLVTYVERIENLSMELEILLNNPSRKPADQKISNYFAAVWRSSLPGELYVGDDQNIEVFVNSLCEIWDS